MGFEVAPAVKFDAHSCFHTVAQWNKNAMKQVCKNYIATKGLKNNENIQKKTYKKYNQSR